MRKLSFLFVLLAMACWSCSNELEDVQLTQKEKNLTILQEMAKNVGIDVEIKLYGKQAIEPLTTQDLDYFQTTFQQMVGLDGMEIELGPKRANSRSIEGFVYNGSAGFNGHSFNLDVYWKVNNETGDVFDIYGGMAGYAEGDIHDYQDYEYQTCCQMFHMGQTLHYANREEISISLHSDYVATQWCYDRLNDREYMMNETTCKVTASGTVDTNAYIGSFIVGSSGPGSWGDEWRDNL